MKISAPKYFLAANSCEGFVSHFDSFYKEDTNWHIYIIKGGPGTGKSSFMKYICAKLYDLGFSVELCPCSSDPGSLDGLIVPQIKVAFLDGTAPHIVEAVYPGVREEIINLGEFWKGDELKNKGEEIVALTLKNKELHTLAKSYLLSAGELICDNFTVSRVCLDIQKAEKYALKLVKEYIPKGKGRGREDIRFIGGITPVGVVSFSKTITDYCDNIVILEDKWGGASGVIMERIKEYALNRGYDIKTLKSPLLPTRIIDHIIIPELCLAFVTENDYVHFKSKVRRVHARRFYHVEVLKQHKNRMRFNDRLSRELLLSGCEVLGKAKENHDALEKHYISAMNFDGVISLAQDILEKIAI